MNDSFGLEKSLKINEDTMVEGEASVSNRLKLSITNIEKNALAKLKPNYNAIRDMLHPHNQDFAETSSPSIRLKSTFSG